MERGELFCCEPVVFRVGFFGDAGGATEPFREIEASLEVAVAATDALRSREVGGSLRAGDAGPLCAVSVLSPSDG